MKVIKFPLLACILVAFFGGSSHVLAQQECIDIRDSLARLTCYDAWAGSHTKSHRPILDIAQEFVAYVNQEATDHNGQHLIHHHITQDCKLVSESITRSGTRTGFWAGGSFVAERTEIDLALLESFYFRYNGDGFINFQMAPDQRAHLWRATSDIRGEQGFPLVFERTPKLADFMSEIQMDSWYWELAHKMKARGTAPTSGLASQGTFRYVFYQSVPFRNDFEPKFKELVAACKSQK